jgi:hypothetical protein
MNPQTCTQGCCGVAARRSVSDCFDRGLRRNRLPPLEIEGPALRDANGLEARFSLTIEYGRIANVRFRVTSCVALVAYAEVLAEEAVVLSPQSAAAIAPSALIALLDGVPAFRRDRAGLATAALRAAILSATANPRESTDESRLHLRHAAP